jgi:hypothetical protein
MSTTPTNMSPQNSGELALYAIVFLYASRSTVDKMAHTSKMAASTATIIATDSFQWTKTSSITSDRVRFTEKLMPDNSCDMGRISGSFKQPFDPGPIRQQLVTADLANSRAICARNSSAYSPQNIWVVPLEMLSILSETNSLTSVGTLVLQYASSTDFSGSPQLTA